MHEFNVIDMDELATVAGGSTRPAEVAATRPAGPSGNLEPVLVHY